MKLIRNITVIAIVLSVLSVQAIGIDLAKIIGKNKSIQLSKLPGISTIANTPAGAFLKNISIDNLKLDASGKEQKASGEVNIFGEKLAGSIDRRKDDAGNFFLAFDLSLPQGFKFSKINSKLKPMDVVSITEGSLIISTGEYEDDAGNNIVKGVNLAATFGANQKAIKGFDKFLNFLTKKLRVKIDPSRGLSVVGQITPTFANSFFGLKIPAGLINLGRFKGKYIFAMKDLGFGLRLKPTGLAITLEGDAKVNFPLPIQIFGGAVKEQPFFSIEDRAVIAFDVAATEISLNLQNTYDAFGFVISQGVGFALSPEAAEALGIGQLQINGKAKLPNGKSLDFAGKLDITENANFVLRGGFPQGMNLEDIVETITAMVDAVAKVVAKKDLNLTKLVKGKIPKLGIQQAYATVSLKPDTIGEGEKAIQVPMGAIGNLTVDILGIKPSIAGQISTDGISFTGSVNKIKEGPFTLSGKGKGGGPVIKLELNPKKAGKFLSFFLSADAALAIPKMPKISGDVLAAISVKGIDLELETKVGKELFDMSVDIHMPKFSAPQNWKFAGNLSNKAQTQIANALKQAGLSLRKDFEKAAHKLKEAENKLRPIKEKADSIKKKLDREKRDCKHAKVWHRPKHCARVVKYGVEWTAVKGTYEASKGILEGAKKAMHGLGKGAKAMGRISSVALRKGVQIKELKFDVSLDALKKAVTKGEGPEFDIVAVFFGKEVKVKARLDLTKGANLVNQVKNIVLKKVKEIF